MILAASGLALCYSWISPLDLLRECLGLTDARKGCGHGQCGACTCWLTASVSIPAQWRFLHPGRQVGRNGELGNLERYGLDCKELPRDLRTADMLIPDRSRCRPGGFVARTLPPAWRRPLPREKMGVPIS